MLYRVIYMGVDGDTLKDEQFDAADIDDALELLANSPTLVPPPDTTDVHVRLIKASS